MRTGGETTRFHEEVNRQHSWTAQKNSRKDVMADQRIAKTVVKKTELESQHQIEDSGEGCVGSEDSCEGKKDCESVDC